MQPFVETFVAELPGQVSQLWKLLEEKNLQHLHEIAHRLKGTGGLFGFDSISKLASSVETSLRENEPLEKIAREVHQLIDLVRRVEGYRRSAESNPTKL